MRKFTGWVVKKNKIICILAGLAVVLAALIFYVVLKEESIITYHDQLDGEVPAYLYQAKYLFSGADTIPEFMNGASKSTLTAAAPLGILFYKMLPAFKAFITMQTFVMTVAYLGMFALIWKSTKKVSNFWKNGITSIILMIILRFQMLSMTL